MWSIFNYHFHLRGYFLGKDGQLLKYIPLYTSIVKLRKNFSLNIECLSMTEKNNYEVVRFQLENHRGYIC